MSKKISNGLNVSRLDQVIIDLGVRVCLYKSTLCPNMTSLESLDHDPNCTICNNNMIDFDPQETLALFQQQDLIEQYKLQGTFSMDEILVSFLSGVTLHHYSKMELLDFSEDFYELIQRQTGASVDVLKYKACTVIGCFGADGSGNQVNYHFGTDFELDPNGSIKWISSHKPEDRTIYSIYYKYHPVFRAIKAVHRDRYSQWNLRTEKLTSPSIEIDGKTYVKAPEAWIFKRSYLLKRTDFDKNLIPPNEYYDPNE